MGKNRSASGITNVIQYDNNGNITFVSGSTTLMQVSSSGAITTTGVISGSNALSASFSLNSALLNGTGSVGFATTASLLTVSSSQQQISASQQQLSSSFLILTASFNAVSSSQQQISSSLLQVSASYIALSGSYNTFSGSASTRITDNSSSIQQVSASQQQISASLLNVISIFATTGSNSFRANQSITGSLVVSSTITAQTLIVQTVTSSIVYSSGSNIFGCDLNSRQTFTGSVLITGSLTIAAGGNASAPTIFGSTIACSPIGCFATSCATSFIGGTMSGTTIYGSTAVCSPVGKFTSCLDLGGALTGTSATFSGNLAGSGYFLASSITGLVTIQGNAGGNAFNQSQGLAIGWNYTAGGGEVAFSSNKGAGSVGGFKFYDWNGTTATQLLSILPSGAATFSSTITGTTIYGSTAVCSAVGKFTTCIDAGSGAFSSSVGIGTTLSVTGATSLSCRLSVGGSDQSYASIFVGGAITTGTNQWAFLTDPQLAGTGDNYAVYANARIKASTAVTNAFGVYILSAEKLSGATIVNNYALYIANQTSGTTLNYSIYSSGGLNYFGGCVGIGISSPAFKLHTVGAGFIGRQNNYGSYDAADADLIISNYNSDNTSLLLFNSVGAYHSGLVNYYNNTLSLGLNNSNSTNSIVTSTSINITATGVGIGATAPSNLLHICGAGTSVMLRLQNTTTVSGDQGPLIQFMSANQVGNQNFETGYIQSIWQAEGNAFGMRFATKGVDASQSEKMRITHAGITCFAGTVCAPCFATISDYRMKSNVRPIEGLSIIMNTKPYKFEYNYDCSTSFGMIAHELQDTVPEAVFGYKDGEVMQGVDYMKLLPIAIKAIQEQQCKIALLESCLGIA